MVHSFIHSCIHWPCLYCEQINSWSFQRTYYEPIIFHWIPLYQHPLVNFPRITIHLAIKDMIISIVIVVEERIKRAYSCYKAPPSTANTGGKCCERLWIERTTLWFRLHGSCSFGVISMWSSHQVVPTPFVWASGLNVCHCWAGGKFG